MESKLPAILVLSVAVLLIFGCAGQQQQPPASNSNSPNPGSAAGATQPSLVGTKFSDWKYYPMAFQIAPGPISADNQAALNVFSVQQTPQADGSILVRVTDNAEGTQSNFTLQSGEILYFADGNPNDDVGNESDVTLVDDHFVVVDSSGNIVEMLSTP